MLTHWVAREQIGARPAACAAPNDESSAGDVDDPTGASARKQLVKGNSAFATDLYGELTTGNDNVFFSPYSISSALAMTVAGARRPPPRRRTSRRSRARR